MARLDKQRQRRSLLIVNDCAALLGSNAARGTKLAV